MCKQDGYDPQTAIRQGYKNCSIKTINAAHLDDLVKALLLNHLHQHENINKLHMQKAQVRDRWLREFIGTVYLAPDKLTIQLNTVQIEAYKAQVPVELNDEQTTPEINLPTCLYQPDIEKRGQQVTLSLKIQIKKLDHRRIIVSPDGPDLFMPENPESKNHIVHAIGQAHHWHQELAKHDGSPIMFC